MISAPDLRLALVMTILALTAGCGHDAGSASSAGGSGGQGGGGGATTTTGAGGSGTSATTSTTTSATGSGGMGGAAPTCDSGLTQDTAECQICQDASCCITATAAAENPGTWTTSGATICREANCFAECGVAQPECGGIQPSPASCTEALYAACCAEVEACAKSDECTAVIYLCIDDQGCAPGSACFDACVADLPGGLAVFEALDVCFSTVTCT